MKESPPLDANAAGASVRVRVWDLPTRVFHWALVAAVTGLAVTGKLGGEWMPWHARAGYTVLALLLFRLVWGVVGGHWSRFTRFAPSSRALLAYLRQPASAEPAGHSPLGWLSVLALLVVLFLQVGTGLVSDDREDFAGPLNAYVSNDAARLATGYHKVIGEPLIYALVALHVAAIAFYRVRRRRRLTRAMWTGDKTLPRGLPSSRDDGRTRWLALAVLSLCACAVAALVLLASGAA
ncbi:MAG TPA: cytochrome b/b6 domain-containing protein [Ramlibacter sp.]|nr:cytochrome b/b6 domain-containing protein [Ramlibacter sp.]